MFGDFLSNMSQYIHTNPWLALAAVFMGGVLTASSPCVLAMIPMMMGLVADDGEDKRKVLRSFLLSGTFVLGLSITFTLLGILAASAGGLYKNISGVWTWIVAGVCVLMGLHLTGLVTIPIPSLGNKVPTKTKGFLGGFVMGLIFGVVSAPCIAPILVVLLTYLAGSGSSLWWGGLLLFVYALGHSILIMAAGTSMGAAKSLVENKKTVRVMEYMRRITGVMIILVGFYFGYRGLR